MRWGHLTLALGHPDSPGIRAGCCCKGRGTKNSQHLAQLGMLQLGEVVKEERVGEYRLLSASTVRTVAKTLAFGLSRGNHKEDQKAEKEETSSTSFLIPNILGIAKRGQCR